MLGHLGDRPRGHVLVAVGVPLVADLWDRVLVALQPAASGSTPWDPAGGRVRLRTLTAAAAVLLLTACGSGPDAGTGDVERQETTTRLTGTARLVLTVTEGVAP